MIALLGAAARYGRVLLVVGLLAGLGLPALASDMRPWLPELVAGMMFVSALRIGPARAFGALRELRVTVVLVALYQVVLPLTVTAGLWAAGLGATALGTALILATSAPSIAGSPNLTVMTGGNPAPALQLLIVGTALLPLTVLPVFLLAGNLGGPETVLWAAARLTAVILLATAAGFALRALALPDPGPRGVAALDGLSAIMMAVLVVGLMAAAGPALSARPGAFFAWLAAACTLNFGLQIAAATLLRRIGPGHEVVPLSIVAGNRNIALFLVALPPQVTEPLLLFIACYQIPMYLTPMLMRRFYRV